MIDYYKILSIPKGASKYRAFRAFKKRYLSEIQMDNKIEILTGFAIIAHERQKFLDILLNQFEKGVPFNSKYLAIIASERGKAASIISHPDKEFQVVNALKDYPFKEVFEGFFYFFISGGSRYYFEFSYISILIGIVTMFQYNQDTLWLFMGFLFVITGIYTHIRIVENVKMSKIEEMLSSPHSHD